jgi:hypothetical protein
LKYRGGIAGLDRAPSFVLLAPQTKLYRQPGSSRRMG